MSDRLRRERVKPGIYKRIDSDGSTKYEIMYRDSDGRKRRETVGTRLRDAEARLVQAKADMSRGVRVAASRDLTVAVAAERWLEASGHLRATTLAAYEASLRTHVLPAFGNRRLETVTPDDVARWAQRMRTVAYRVEADRRAYPKTAEQNRPTTPLRAATIGLALKTLHRVFAHAIRRQGFAGTSPVAALERAERPTDEVKPRVILTPDELAAVVAVATPAYRDVLAFLAGSGCRVGEALGLTWGDIDFAAGTARITAQLDRNGQRVPLKTRNARRTLDLPRSLVERLKRRKLSSAHSSDHLLVFSTAIGGALDHRNVARRGLVAACRKAGLPVISPHGIRHAHASALLADGWDLAAVSRRLGHGSVAITASTYAHLLEDAERRQARRDRLDGLYGSSTSDVDEAA